MMNKKQVYLMMKPKVTPIVILMVELNLRTRKIMMNLMNNLFKVKKVF